jgi:hypothetical protein
MKTKFRKIKKITKSTIIAFWLLPVSLFMVSPNLADARPVQAGAQELSKTIGAQAEISKVLGVLESRVEDYDLLETAKRKFLTLDHHKTRLLSSLCDRIVSDGHTAGSDVAFLLMTILIVLS